MPWLDGRPGTVWITVRASDTDRDSRPCCDKSAASERCAREENGCCTDRQHEGDGRAGHAGLGIDDINAARVGNGVQFPNVIDAVGARSLGRKSKPTALSPAASQVIITEIDVWLLLPALNVMNSLPLARP